MHGIRYICAKIQKLMDIKELFSSIFPWLIITFAIWSGYNEHKKKKREAEAEAEAERRGNAHSHRARSIPEPPESPWAALLANAEIEVAPPPAPRRAEPPVQPRQRPQQPRREMAPEAEGTAAVRIDPAKIQAIEKEREAAEMRRRQRRAALRRAIIWSETLPPKFK